MIDEPQDDSVREQISKESLTEGGPTSQSQLTETRQSSLSGSARSMGKN
jgi:hypothetical protein